MSTFADKLNELCRAEAARAIGNPEASSRMTLVLLEEVANAVAVLTQGDKLASRRAGQEITGALAQMVFKKSALVRRSGLVKGARP